MNKIFNKTINMLSLTLSFVLSLGVFMQSCSMDLEDEIVIDESILFSPELEEFFIAGVDFERSLDIFINELNTVDFSKLEVSYDAEGRKMRKLPVGSVSIEIDKKIQIVNEKKATLLKKFPQFASMRKEICIAYFNQSMKNSANIKSEFLKLGINLSSPKLKNGAEEGGYGTFHFMDECYFNSFMNWWMGSEYSSSYVELFIIIYADGTIGTYRHPNATDKWTTIAITNGNDGKKYFPEGGSSSHIIEVAHTHKSGPHPTTDSEGLIKEGIVPGVPNSIYYNGSITCFYNCPEDE